MIDLLRYSFPSILVLFSLGITNLQANALELSIPNDEVSSHITAPTPVGDADLSESAQPARSPYEVTMPCPEGAPSIKGGFKDVKLRIYPSQKAGQAARARVFYRFANPFLGPRPFAATSNNEIQADLARRRALHEINITKRMLHLGISNIVPCEVSRLGSSIEVEMPYLPKGDLYSALVARVNQVTRMASEPAASQIPAVHLGLSVAEVFAVARDVGLSLAQMHQHKIVHRDVKLENIFSDGYRYFLGDYGLAYEKNTEYPLLDPSFNVFARTMETALPLFNQLALESSFGLSLADSLASRPGLRFRADNASFEDMATFWFNLHRDSDWFGFKLSMLSIMSGSFNIGAGTPIFETFMALSRQRASLLSLAVRTLAERRPYAPNQEGREPLRQEIEFSETLSFEEHQSRVDAILTTCDQKMALIALDGTLNDWHARQFQERAGIAINQFFSALIRVAGGPQYADNARAWMSTLLAVISGPNGFDDENIAQYITTCQSLPVF